MDDHGPGSLRAVLGRIAIGMVLALPLAGAALPAGSPGDTLLAAFRDPPDAARPRAWWHWMDGNITREGIRLDLEWMHRIGLGGFQNFDAALGAPQVVEQRLAYMTPEWRDAFRYAAMLADGFHMEESIAGSPGWSESGGPWVAAGEGMKKYVWSETLVEGGAPFRGTLAPPPTETGQFQDLQFHDANPFIKGVAPPPAHYYRDSVVVAFRRAATDVPLESLHPRVTASSPATDLALLADGDHEHTTSLPIPDDAEGGWVQYAFDSPQTIRAASVALKNLGLIDAIRSLPNAPEQSLEASDDGKVFRTLARLPAGRAPQYTTAIEPATARYFRVAFRRRRADADGPDARAEARGMVGKPQVASDIAEIVLHPGARVQRFEDKAAFATEPDLYRYATPAAAPADVVPEAGVLDLTARLAADGSLDWTPPPGQWVVLRFGYSLIGTLNHPATAEATGLEVDKLDRSYVKKYADAYLDTYKDAVGSDWMGRRGIRYVISDSWEAGSQNWTDHMIERFRALRGYDPVPWMPVLAGRVVESAQASDRFLWDFRRTISDLIATEHYGQLQASLHERGMGLYAESHESGRAFVADGMEVKKYSDVPMAEISPQMPGGFAESPRNNADDREAASVAHIYGQNLAAAESFTTALSAWAWSPATLKPTVDMEFLNGINRVVIHESTHQPLVGKAPGLTLGPYGQWFNRNETWAGLARPWIDYIARSSYLLQQGRFAADVAWFYGEDSNLTAIYADSAPAIPAGHGFDYVNADALMHAFSVVDGRLQTPGGMSYRVLGLDPHSRHMSLPVLRALHALVLAGAVVAGPGPVDDPSLADDPAEFRRLAGELFGDGPGVRHVGRGVVYAGLPIQAALDALHVQPDFEAVASDASAVGKPGDNAPLQFVHRRLADGDLYFVVNRSSRSVAVDARFRVAGRVPELWRAEQGTSARASYRIAGGHTIVPLSLEPWGSTFVVFRKPTRVASMVMPSVPEARLATLAGPWQLAFGPGACAPAATTVDTLASWSGSADPGVRYFSGTGTYTRSFEAGKDWLARGARILVDLGDVAHLAEVSVNGKPLGVAWHAPYRVDMTPALHAGSNEISVSVTNSWVNRLVGDQQPGATPCAYTPRNPYKADSALLPSGLLGPVEIIRAATR